MYSLIDHHEYRMMQESGSMAMEGKGNDHSVQNDRSDRRDVFSEDRPVGSDPFPSMNMAMGAIWYRTPI